MGIHNAYNAVAAVAAAAELGIAPRRAISALETFHPRFGPAEEFLFDDSHLWLALIKNPAGAGSVIRDVCADRRVGAVVGGDQRPRCGRAGRFVDLVRRVRTPGHT